MRYLRIMLILILVGISKPLVADLKIQFYSERDGGGPLGLQFEMNPDGSEPVNLNRLYGVHGPLRRSPDRTRVLYYLRIGVAQEIFVKDADGINPVRLTNDPRWDGKADWSPDGTKIVWERQRLIAGSDIFVMDADGSNQRDLGPGFTPKWSPDGTKIAFIAGFWQVPHIMNADGSDRHGVVWGVIMTSNLSWSPDGTKLTFTENNAGAPPRWLIDKDGNEVADEHGRIRIDERNHTYVVNIDGSGCLSLTRALAGNEDNVYRISWRSDGRKIAYRLNDDVYVANPDGTNPVNLTKHHGMGSDGGPSWSPDDSTIVFSTNRDGNSDIYSMNADGTNPVKLTNHPAADWGPSWLNTNFTAVSPQDKRATTWGQVKSGKK